MKNIDKYAYNGYKYSIDYDVEGHKNLITHNKEKPEYLYKFYSLSKNSLSALTEGYLFASHPIELNDCLDSCPFLLFTSKPIDFELYDNIFGFAYEDENKQELIDYWEEDCKPNNLCKGYISHMYSMAFNLMGLISMTAKENNPLMWPHYTQEKGFQLKFKTGSLEKSIQENLENGDGEYMGLYPLNYTKALNPIDIHTFKTLLVPFVYATNVKSNEWEYEQEWRFLISNHNMGVPFSKSGLNLQSDYYVDIANRYAKYDVTLVEEICLGINFFTRQEFDIEWLNKTEFKVKPKKNDGNWEYESYVKFLDYLASNLSDKLYYSGIKYELDKNQKHFIIRTKEQLEIHKQDDDSYILKRTSNVIKLMDKANI